MDFKAPVPLRDGAPAEPLTIQDIKSRSVLEVRLLRANTYAGVRRALWRVFRRYGLPRVIRVDNGPPFGGGAFIVTYREVVDGASQQRFCASPIRARPAARA